jgi:phospholipase C
MAVPGLGSVDHLVVLMLENRSFDHMLGFLYAGNGNTSATPQAFDGLTGNESNPDGEGNAVPVFRITPELDNAYWYPLCDPGEGYYNTNEQLFGRSTAPTPAAATNQDYPDTRSAPAASFGLFTDFENEAAAGTLPAFSFLEPEWASGGPTLENDQHPVSNLANGEGLILQVCRAVKNGPKWASTLLVLTYDEHGGCYDHVPPPLGAAPPGPSSENNPGADGFDFSRFGVRVPTVLVSPLVAAGTVYRAPDGGPPFDHTSVLATIEKRWGIDPLSKRDAAAPDVGSNASSVGTTPTRVLRAHALMAAELPLEAAPIADPEAAVAALKTAKDYSDFIEERLARWNESKPH